MGWLNNDENITKLAEEMQVDKSILQQMMINNNNKVLLS